MFDLALAGSSRRTADTEVALIMTTVTTSTLQSASAQTQQAGKTASVASGAPVLSRAAGLRLSSLTLAGFKSFADKTTFNFSDPITGIVGPNGCGKSNVVDAIKWVLGERSSKSLRGKEMIDVIFAGSAGRKPSGMASVTLTFDNPKMTAEMIASLMDHAGTSVSVEEIDEEVNEEVVEEDTEEGAASETEGVHVGEEPVEIAHASGAQVERAIEQGESEAAEIITQRSRIRRPLPIDADTVAVERRLYRDGKSKYIINGRVARLKDIRDLFLDTGIGADAYSIIEQGKVDRMLLASPMERRVIFEEAAGIAKYRQRRVEATRKLEKTETNLVRTREQLDSTERRLRLVKGQASKARRFQELDSEYRSLRMALAFELYDDIRQRLKGLTSQIASLEDERRETEESLRTAESESNRVNELHHQHTRALREVEAQLTKAKHQAQNAQQRGEMTVRAIEEAARSVELETTRLAESTEKLVVLDQSVLSHGQAVSAIETRLGQAEEALNEANETKLESSRKAATHRQTLDETRAACASIEREHATLLTRVQSDDRRLDVIEEQRAKLGLRIKDLDSQRSSAELAFAEASELIESVETQVASLEANLDTIETREERVGNERSELATIVDELDEQRVRLETRHSTLEEMVKSRVGLDDAVREVLDLKDSGAGFPGVIGSLAELIEVPTGHASEIESALEDALQSVVVESISAMPSADELASLPGRVTFLPLIGSLDSRAPSDLAMNQLSAIAGPRVRQMRSLVRSRQGDARVEALLDRLLGTTLMVGDLDSAMLLAAGPLRGVSARFVTAAGTVIEPDGRVCAGPANDSQAAGLLARRAELDDLSESLTKLLANFHRKRDELESIDEDASMLAKERSVLHSAVGSGKQELIKAQHSSDRHQSDADRLGREIQRIHDEEQSASSRIAEISQERTSLTERAEKLEGLLEEQQAVAKQTQEMLGAIERVLEEANEKVALARVETSTMHEQLRSEQRQVSQAQNQRDETERQCALAQRHIERTTAILDEHQLVAKESLAQEQEAHAQIEKFEGVSSEKLALVKETAEMVRAISETLSQVRDRADAFQRDFHAIELAKRETEVKRENIEERTLEDLGMDLVFEYPEYRHMMDDDSDEWAVVGVEIDPTQARVNVLKSEIKKLGNVNINSIEEESNLTERNDDLISQVKDIDEARIKLATLIEKLNVASRTSFGEVFASIQQEFGGRDGMFRRLFGGGRAEVRLMPLVKEIDGQKVQTDEIDLLESGIEVIAKPPGKEPRSINQLSGGEKTMTAVAMLLAIFRSKPSCFCVLDEVDAALDEANVGRFCSTLDIFAQQSRFIVITHNKRTMQATDKLFGVTMQERGVSKRVEVRFDQVGEDGEIDEKAVKNAPTEVELPVEMVEEPTAKDAKDGGASGSLRAALASMRDEQAANVPSGS